MRRFKHGHGTRGIKKAAGLVIVLLIVGLIGSALAVRNIYNDNLKPLSGSQEKIAITVEPGSVPSNIADELKSKSVIRSDWAFEWYVRNHNLRDQLKAGTYLFTPAHSVPEIVDLIVAGKVATDLVTILPGVALEKIREDLIESGFSAREVDEALRSEHYSNHPALTDKPKNASLEGYLYPESFQKTAETTVKQIIELSLDEMQRRLTPEIRQAFNEQGLSVHQAVTLASIIELEVSNPADRTTVSQVFLKRLEVGLPLQSDATNDYSKNRPEYDTYKIDGLPPGPVANMSGDSLQAVAFPSQTDWLYFVSGDDGKTYFSKTLEEHEALVEKHCHELCGR